MTKTGVARAGIQLVYEHPLATWKLVSGILSMILFGIGTITGFALAGNFSDLNIWAAWCLVNVILAVIAMRKKQKG